VTPARSGRKGALARRSGADAAGAGPQVGGAAVEEADAAVGVDEVEGAERAELLDVLGRAATTSDLLGGHAGAEIAGALFVLGDAVGDREGVAGPAVAADEDAALDDVGPAEISRLPAGDLELEEVAIEGVEEPPAVAAVAVRGAVRELGGGADGEGVAQGEALARGGVLAREGDVHEALRDDVVVRRGAVAGGFTGEEHEQRADAGRHPGEDSVG